MAQHDYVVDNQSFPATRTDINNVLQAIASTNSGTSAPSTTYANQLWYDTTNNKLYIRNEDNDAWIPLFLLDQSNDVAGTLATEIDVEDASGTDTAGTALTIKGGAGTGTGAGGSIIFQTADGAGSTGSSVNAHATVVTITDDGKVGIGVAPSARLHVKDSTDIDMDNSSSGQLKISGGASEYSGAIALNDVGMQIYHNSGSRALIFGTNETERMRITGGGDIGIGKTPNCHFDMDSSANSTEHIVRNTNGGLSGQAVAGWQIRASRSANSAYYLLETRSSNTSDREHVLRGDGNAFADGSWNGGGADYAEYFEWDDDNTNNEDRRGYSVVLTNGDKIRKATSNDATSDIIGVISGNPSVVGDAGYLRWDGKFNRDDFGSIIWETHTLTEWTDADGTEHSYHTDRIPSDVTAPADATVVTVDGSGDTLTRRQTNSSFDETLTYVPREDRQEWDAVGMMGKLRLRAGQPTGDRWIKMRDIATDSDGNVTVEEWLVR